MPLAFVYELLTATLFSTCAYHSSVCFQGHITETNDARVYRMNTTQFLFCREQADVTASKLVATSRGCNSPYMKDDIKYVGWRPFWEGINKI
jgi:hypothetical protein